MAATFYDPEVAPDPQDWLGIDEHERIRLARRFHEEARLKLPNAKAHAVVHAAVENQVASGYRPTCRAIERLQKEGLSRHDAVHAVGTVLAQFIQEEMSAPRPVDRQAELSAAIEALSASSWKALAGDG